MRRLPVANSAAANNGSKRVCCAAHAPSPRAHQSPTWVERQVENLVRETLMSSESEPWEEALFACCSWADVSCVVIKQYMQLSHTLEHGTHTGNTHNSWIHFWISKKKTKKTKKTKQNKKKECLLSPLWVAVQVLIWRYEPSTRLLVQILAPRTVYLTHKQTHGLHISL